MVAMAEDAITGSRKYDNKYAILNPSKACEEHFSEQRFI